MNLELWKEKLTNIKVIPWLISILINSLSIFKINMNILAARVIHFLIFAFLNQWLFILETLQQITWVSIEKCIEWYTKHLCYIFLTHLPLVPHRSICLSELCKHWFRQLLVACSAPSNYLNQHWLIVNWTFRNRLQWNLNQNTKVFIHKNAFEYVVCEMAAILSRGDKLTWYTVHPMKYAHVFVVLHLVVVTLSVSRGLKWRNHPYTSGLLYWHWGNHMIAPVSVK